MYGPGEYVNITDPMILYSEPPVIEDVVLQEQNILSSIIQFLRNVLDYFTVCGEVRS